MKTPFIKKTLSWGLLITLTCIPFHARISADSTGQQTEETPENGDAQAPIPPTLVIEGDEEEVIDPQGTPVSERSQDASSRKNKELIKNLILAGTAVLIAVVSIIVVSNKNGKK